MTWFERKPAIPLAAQSPAGGDLQQRTLEIGGRLLAGVRKHRKGLFSAGFWSDQLVSWTMKDPAFRTQLFRFIDVFPMLRSAEQIHDYLSDYLSQPGVTLPMGLDLGMQAGRMAKGARGQDDHRRHQGHGGQFHRRRRRRGRAARAPRLVEAGPGLQRRPAGRGVCQRRRGRGLPAPLPRSAGGPARRSRPLAGRAAIGERSPWPRAADEHFDQGQRAEPADRRHRLRGLACGPWRTPWRRSSARRPSRG